MTPTFISSSNIDAVGYRLGSLFVRFKNGGCYEYRKVPFTQFDALCKVESAGKYLNAVIKPNFEFVKLTDDPFICGVKK